jgi:hypothetical protein
LYLSGFEGHLDLLVNAGVFKKENRYGDLDTVLCTCEDELLLKYHIDDEHESDDDDDNDDDNDDNDNNNDGSIDIHENIRGNIKGNITNNININEKDLEETKTNEESKIDNELNKRGVPRDQNKNSKNHEISINSKNSDKFQLKNSKKMIEKKSGFSKCLEIMRERYQLSDSTVTELEMLVAYTRPLRLLEVNNMCAKSKDKLLRFVFSIHSFISTLPVRPARTPLTYLLYVRSVRIRRITCHTPCTYTMYLHHVRTPCTY